MRTHPVDAVYQARCANAVSAALRFQWTSPALLAAVGSLALAVGVLVYMTDRDPTRTILLQSIAALPVGPVFGALGSWLPSFVHPFAFSLFTAASMPRAASAAYGACAGWWVVNVAFELGQHAQISRGLAESLQVVFGHNWLTRTLSGYFLRGRFDADDVAAATAGAIAAAVVIQLIHGRETRYAR